MLTDHVPPFHTTLARVGGSVAFLSFFLHLTFWSMSSQLLSHSDSCVNYVRSWMRFSWWLCFVVTLWTCTARLSSFNGMVWFGRVCVRGFGVDQPRRIQFGEWNALPGGSHSVIPSERDTDSSNLASKVPFGRGFVWIVCLFVSVCSFVVQPSKFLPSRLAGLVCVKSMDCQWWSLAKVIVTLLQR